MLCFPFIKVVKTYGNLRNTYTYYVQYYFFGWHTHLLFHVSVLDIWAPEIGFSNTNGNQMTEIDNSLQTTVIRKGTNNTFLLYFNEKFTHYWEYSFLFQCMGDRFPARQKVDVQSSLNRFRIMAHGWWCVVENRVKEILFSIKWWIGTVMRHTCCTYLVQVISGWKSLF